MSQTSVSLLERLRRQPDGADWQRLVDIYTPHIRSWLRRYALPPGDADDVVQEVMAVVVRELPTFEHNQRTGAFRAWLRGITTNRLRTWWRGRTNPALGSGDSDVARRIEQLAHPHSELSRMWDQEHDRHLMGRLLALIEAEFPAT
jgi:RNA polymerase sigma-70 factor (ECF subfamily)